MRSDDFFIAKADEGWGPTVSRGAQVELNVELLNALRRRPVSGREEVSAAQGLVGLVREELESYGTGGGERLDDREIALVIRAMEAVLARLAVPLKLPFRDFTRFRSYWMRNDGYGSWQARRDILDGFFEPVVAPGPACEMALDELAEAVSPRPTTGWLSMRSSGSCGGDFARRSRHRTTEPSVRTASGLSRRCIIVTS